MFLRAPISRRRSDDASSRTGKACHPDNEVGCGKGAVNRSGSFTGRTWVACVLGVGIAARAHWLESNPQPLSSTEVVSRIFDPRTEVVSKSHLTPCTPNGEMSIRACGIIEGQLHVLESFAAPPRWQPAGTPWPGKLPGVNGLLLVAGGTVARSRCHCMHARGPAMAIGDQTRQNLARSTSLLLITCPFSAILTPK
jgi:hypothetical protein